MTIPQLMMKHPFQTLLVLAGFMVLLFLPVVFVSLLLLGALIPSIRHKVFGNEEDNLASTTKKGNSTSTLRPNAKRMTTAEYHSYLKSPEWKALVSKVKARDKVCQLTGATTQLEVHHITYDRLGNEDLSDLVLLSRDAHQSVHDYYGSYSRENTYPINNLRNKL
jgi:hypothetical protein